MDTINQPCVKDIPLYWKTENGFWCSVHHVLIFEGEGWSIENLVVNQYLGLAPDGGHEHDITYGDLLPYADRKVKRYRYRHGDGCQSFNQLFIQLADE